MGKIIANRYHINNFVGDLIGHGGMGHVYRALDEETKRIVAVKHLKGDMADGAMHLVERFTREAEALRRLNHPNIVSVLDSVVEGDEHYIIMEYVPGGSLDELLARQPQLPLERVLRIGLELADALTRAHHLNIIHRDLKPANVLLAEDGTPRLTDFGVAHLEDMARITQSGVLTGTYAYLSPEACEGQVLDVRTDIWSFGVMLYEMLGGRRPFQEHHITATITAILTKPVPDLAQFRPDAPEALTSLIYHMLMKNREERLGSVRLAGAQLEAIMSGSRTLPTPTGPRFPTTPDSLRPIVPMMGPRHNLPAQPTPFVGRTAEIAEVVALLAEPDCRLLTLLGPGGMGKTRLSIEVARQQVTAFVHGVRFVALASVATSDLLVTAVADALNLTLSAADDPQEQLHNYLREKQMLLVLDNFEHLLDGADMVSGILAVAPEVKVLATSRESLNLWEEWVQPVQGLTYPHDPTATDGPAAESYSAVQLFAARARRVRRQFEVTADLAHIVRICQLVEGMPLGIELAATWLKTLSPAQIAAEIAKNLDFLATSMRNIESRHRSMRAVFDYSWQLLTPAEQRVLPRLALFRGGFERRAAEAVAEADLLTLNGLVNKSLLSERNAEGETTVTGDRLRYDLHELLRQYLWEKLEAAGETAVTEARHAAYYTQFLYKQRMRLRSPQQKTAADAIGQELDNVRLAWQWSVAHVGDTEDAQHHLAHANDSLWMFLVKQGFVLEGRDLFGTAVAAVDSLLVDAVDPPPQLQVLLAELLGWLGMFFFELGQQGEQSLAFDRALTLLRSLAAQELDAETAEVVKRHMILPLTYHSYRVSITGAEAESRQMLEDAAALSREIGDTWRLSQVTNMKAIRTNVIAEKRRLFQEYLTLAQELGDLQNIARAQMNLSTTQENREDAQALLRDALQIYLRLDTPKGIAYAYANLADGAFQGADYHTARQYYEQALNLFTDIGSNAGILGTLYGLGNTYWALQELDIAQQQLVRTLTYARERGDLENTIKLLNTIATFMAERGDTKGATEKYLESLTLLSQLQTDHQRAEALDSLGNLALLLGKYEAAKRHFSKNKALFEQSRDLRGAAWSLRNLGTIAYVLGDYEEARVHYEESLTLHNQVDNVWGQISLLNDLGRTAFAVGDEETAVARYRAALRLYQNIPVLVMSFAVIVDWARLLVKHGEKVRALTYLTLITENPNFNPIAVDHFTRDKAARLLAELRADLPAQTVAEITARSAQRDCNEIVAELLDE